MQPALQALIIFFACMLVNNNMQPAWGSLIIPMTNRWEEEAPFKGSKNILLWKHRLSPRWRKD